jgi:signal transduction histidine kinase
LPQSPRSINRLPFWNLFFLALILSGGGFFWHATYQQELLAQVEKHLLTTQLDITTRGGNESAKGGAPQSLCAGMSGVTTAAPSSVQIAVYSPQGELTCTWPATTDSPKTIEPSTTTTLHTVVGQQSYQRVLVFPVSHPAGISSMITVSSDLAGIQKQTNFFSMVLFLMGIAILTGFSVIQRKFRNRDVSAIANLTRTINETDTQLVPPVSEINETASPEILTLVKSYNELMKKRSDSLRRARQFAADVTHELRTPLTILRGETELALRSDRDKDQLQQVLASNLEEISRMSYLIEDLLLLSKGDLGEIPLKKEPLLLNELITELHHQAQLLATAKNIKVDLHCPEQPLFVHADSFRLRQVFLNLLTNAIKYTPQDGNVTIELRRRGENIEVSIRDNGIGMDSEHLELIFERFYRVNKTSNRNDGGSGLGLAIVKWIVNAHRGSITVNSTPNQGSQFTVALPLIQPDQDASENSGEAAVAREKQ